MRQLDAGIAVVGAGLAGRACALALALGGRQVALLDPRPPAALPADDGRTTAVMHEGLGFLARLGLGPMLANAGTPLRRLRIVDLGAGEGTPRADVTFAAEEVGLEAFGRNLANHRLAQALDDALAAAGVERVTGVVQGLEREAARLTLLLADGGRVRASLAVAADGRDSALRRLAGIGVRRHDYGQSAIVTSFGHALPHADTSIELHRPGGPFTLVPLRGRRSSLVWVEPAAEAQRLLGLDEPAFAAELGRRVEPWLGAVHAPGRRHLYPLVAIKAERLAAPRLVLLAEAAHALSPVGAQGLNLSLRDAAVLAEVMAGSGDPGAADPVVAYARRRATDVAARFWATDGLNRLVRTDLAPLARARGLGLDLLGQVPPLRRGLMRAMLAG